MKMYFLLKPHSIHGTGIFSYIFHKNHPHVVRKCHTWILLKHGYFSNVMGIFRVPDLKVVFFFCHPSVQQRQRHFAAVELSKDLGKNIVVFFGQKFNRTFRSESIRYFCFFVGGCRFCIYFGPVFPKKTLNRYKLGNHPYFFSNFLCP